MPCALRVPPFLQRAHAACIFISHADQWNDLHRHACFVISTQLLLKCFSWMEDSDVTWGRQALWHCVQSYTRPPRAMTSSLKAPSRGQHDGIAVSSIGYTSRVGMLSQFFFFRGVGFLLVFWFLSMVQKHAGRWTSDSESPIACEGVPCNGLASQISHHAVPGIDSRIPQLDWHLKQQVRYLLRSLFQNDIMWKISNVLTKLDCNMSTPCDLRYLAFGPAEPTFTPLLCSLPWTDWVSYSFSCFNSSAVSAITLPFCLQKKKTSRWPVPGNPLSHTPMPLCWLRLA